jgi:hypothetical protein
MIYRLRLSRPEHPAYVPPVRPLQLFATMPLAITRPAWISPKTVAICVNTGDPAFKRS